MGLVDFKSEKTQSEDINNETPMEEEFGNAPCVRGSNNNSAGWGET